MFDIERIREIIKDYYFNNNYHELKHSEVQAIEELKDRYVKLDLENQALFEAINCNDSSSLVRIFKEQKDRCRDLEERIDELEYKLNFSVERNLIFEKLEESEKAYKKDPSPYLLVQIKTYKELLDYDEAEGIV